MAVTRGLQANQILIGAGAVLAAGLVGTLVTAYANFAGDSLSRLAALPALFLLGLLLVLSRKVLLLLIILFRASADLLFEATRISIGGYQIGVGGLINAFVLLIAFLLVLEHTGRLPTKRVLGIWAAFLATALFAGLASPVKADALKIYLSLLSYFAIFISAFFFVRSARDFRVCAGLVLWSSVIPAAYAFVDIALHWNSGGPNGFRLQSTFTHPNILACYLTLVLSLAFYILKSGEPRMTAAKRTGLSAYMLLLLGLLVLTKTRSAWIASFAMFTAYSLIFERRYLLYLALVSLASLFVPGVRDRLLDLGSNNEYVQYATLNSFAWRRLIWETGLRWMQPENYLLGYGLDAFRYYSPQFFPLAGKANPGAHNVYVQWLFEVGVAGLLALAWLFGRLLWWLKSLIPIDRLGAFIAIFLVVQYLTICVSDNLTYYLAFNWYFWFIVGAGCAVVTVEARGKQPQAPQPRMSGRAMVLVRGNT